MGESNDRSRLSPTADSAGPEADELGGQDQGIDRLRLLAMRRRQIQRKAARADGAMEADAEKSAAGPAREAGPAAPPAGAAAEGAVAGNNKAAILYNQEHAELVQQFNANTLGACLRDGGRELDLAKVEQWQAAHSLVADGMVGPKTLHASMEGAKQKEKQKRPGTNGTKQEKPQEEQAKKEQPPAASILPLELQTCVDPVSLSEAQVRLRLDKIKAVLLTNLSSFDRQQLEEEKRTLEGELEGRKKTVDVNQKVTETITDATDERWNLTSDWDSKFHVYVNQASHTAVVTLKIYSTATDSVKAGWKNAIESKWSNQYSLDVKLPAGQSGPPTPYSIRVVCQWVDSADKADQVVNPNDPGHDTGGTVGQGGTLNMGNWGTADNVDVTHEFGHMLGNPEEYFTTNGVSYGTPRVEGGGVMNNPAEDPLARHYDLIRQNAAKAMGVDASRCEVRK